MVKSAATPIPARRPWYRLHLSTWLTLPLELVVAVCIILPGESGQYPVRPTWYEAYETANVAVLLHPKRSFWDSLHDNNAVIHGWPLPFLWRTPPQWTGDPANATRGLPWKLTDSVREFRFLPLVVDLAVAGFGLRCLRPSSNGGGECGRDTCNSASENS